MMGSTSSINGYTTKISTAERWPTLPLTRPCFWPAGRVGDAGFTHPPSGRDPVKHPACRYTPATTWEWDTHSAANRGFYKKGVGVRSGILHRRRGFLAAALAHVPIAVGQWHQQGRDARRELPPPGRWERPLDNTNSSAAACTRVIQVAHERRRCMLCRHDTSEASLIDPRKKDASLYVYARAASFDTRIWTCKTLPGVL
ncbi:hypothetical protein MTO96_049425 [Rhipicephalus appendiculatus]